VTVTSPEALIEVDVGVRYDVLDEVYTGRGSSTSCRSPASVDGVLVHRPHRAGLHADELAHAPGGSAMAS
jgi:hypothetical protein